MVILIVIITGILLLLSVVLNVNFGYALTVSLLMFIVYAIKLGYDKNKIWQMILIGIKKALIVVSVLAVIGALTAIWMESGTVPFLIISVLKIINPKMFILLAFLLSCVLSYLIGSSLGTATTIGVVLMAIAKSGGINPYLAAGAILCGAFWGDRGSPLSSALMLNSSVTKTKMHD